MDSPSPPSHGRTGARRLSRAARAAAALLALALAACSASKPPEVAQAPAPAPEPAKPPPPASQETVVVVHQAALFGRFLDQRGPTISVQSFVSTSKEPPSLGTKGTLFIEKKGSRKKDDWQTLGDVAVSIAADAKGKMQFKVAADEPPRGKAKKRLGRSGKIAKDARVKFAWEW